MCVFKKMWLFGMLAAGVFECQAQLQLLLVDSSFQTKDDGQVGAIFTKKNGKQKISESAGGSMLNGAIDYYCSNCKISSDGRFSFDRNALYASGSDIVIWAFKNGGKYTDTLRLHVPRIIAVSAVRKKLKVNPSHPLNLDFQILFDNGESVSSSTHPHLLKTISYRNFPADFGIENGRLYFSGTNYYDSCLIDYFVEGLPHVGGQITAYPSYVYTMHINRLGNKGSKGSQGSSGYSGRGSSPNGQSGQSGGNGLSGDDGQDLTMKLQTLESGIVKVEIDSRGLTSEVYYIDLQSGGKLIVDISGGQGGDGGEGGKGGAGNNATERYAAGYGGNGGDGGYGGHGGRGGNLSVYTDSAASRYIDQITLINKGGRGGNGGDGGSGGSGGSDNNARLLDILITGRRGNRGRTGSPGNDGQNGFPMSVYIR